MKTCYRLLASAVIVLGFVRPSLAAPTLSLSTTANPSSIGLGQVITIDVELNGFQASQEFDSLVATVAFDSSLLGVPSVTAGPILPNPLDDPLDLFVTESAGLVDVAFLTFGLDAAEHVTTDGVFFTIEVAPVGVGVGMIDFDFVGATIFNAANPNNPTLVAVETGPPLSFAVIPEPSSLVLIFVALLGIVARRCCRRRCRA